MDAKVVDNSRRASVLSTRSVRFAADSYVKATDRYQRQAGLSLQTEERRPSRPPLVHEESIEPAFLEDIFSPGQTENITSLSRADSCLSPLEAHPGHRLRGFSFASGPLSPSLVPVPGPFVKPFPEPADIEQHDQPRRCEEPRFSSIRRIDTTALTYAPSRIQHSASDAQEQKRNHFRRIYHQFRGRGAVKPGAFTGLELASSVATLHASSTLSGSSRVLHDRRGLYVLDFAAGEDDLLHEERMLMWLETNLVACA